MPVELNDAFFAQAAGWEAMKQARALLASGRVLSSNWTPPLLKGVVQDGTLSLRAGLVIKSERDIENICTCRTSREWGTLCAHSVAVGLHHLKRLADESAAARQARSPGGTVAPAKPRTTKKIQRAPEGDAGESAEIHVIFPPNLSAALERGKAMLCFEGSWDGGRCPLNALPPNRAFQFPPQDAALLDAIELLAGGDTPALLMLGAVDFSELLTVMTGHPRLTLGRSTEINVTRDRWPLPLKATLESNGEIVLSLKPGIAVPVLIGQGWIFRNNVFQPVALPASCRDVLQKPVRWPRSQVPVFLSRDWPMLQGGGSPGAVEADFRIEDFVLEPQPPRFLLHLAGGLAQLQAQLQCPYGARIMTAGMASADDAGWLPDPQSITRYFTRDTVAERTALARLLRAGFKGPDDRGRLLLSGENSVLNFLAREYPKFQKEWQVTLEERMEQVTLRKLERVTPKFEITSSGVQWFDFSVSFESGDGQKFSPADIQRLLLSGQSSMRLRNGRIAVIDTGAVEELQQVLLDCAPEQRDGRYRIDQTQAAFLEGTLREQGWKARAPDAWRERARRQSGEAKLECPPLGALDTVLRPYQKDGVAWLRFLRENGFGGILADEMGLGKTLQTLAFLQCHLKESAQPPAPGSPDSPFRTLRSALVICPTSLVFNWVQEAQKFTPGLKVLALHGPDRQSLFDRIPESDLVVTSYALIRRDLDRYREFEFDTIVLDEAQHIKNRATQNAQAVKSIRSRHRLVLTGTPLENSVLDIWSIFDFLMPGYLGGAKDFRERYEVPIGREHNAEAQSRLSRRLRPFLLRRLKRDVAKDLPAKIEQVSFCELTGDQRAVYQQLMDAGRQEILVADPASGKSRMLALNVLLRLRQACCDLRLLKIEQAGSESGSVSGKLDLFEELIEEAIDGGHRVLVFSQFVSMLTLLREALESWSVDYCYLDGSTSDRAAVVTRFQQTQVPVFLISLKAGGTGLNLSGADTVVHFDPWWNPAVEDQATDRAHRIGQTRVVTSYKLIARDTVEEKILQLQNKKRSVIQATLGGEEQFMESLTWSEIQELFAT
jgi:superfamily II DNA or RNA helicase